MKHAVEGLQLGQRQGVGVEVEGFWVACKLLSSIAFFQWMSALRSSGETRHFVPSDTKKKAHGGFTILEVNFENRVQGTEGF